MRLIRNGRAPERVRLGDGALPDMRGLVFPFQAFGAPDDGQSAPDANG
jgi:hypothetical protein